jgi:hypothetical protein
MFSFLFSLQVVGCYFIQVLFYIYKIIPSLEKLDLAFLVAIFY